MNGAVFIMDLQVQTEQLIERLSMLKEKYTMGEKPVDRKDKKFFNLVKEETDPIFELVTTWEKNALAFVKDKNVAVHPQQIISTKENIFLLIMHSYYIDVRKRRYMELNQSVYYVLKLLLKDLSLKHSL